MTLPERTGQPRTRSISARPVRKPQRSMRRSAKSEPTSSSALTRRCRAATAASVEDAGSRGAPRALSETAASQFAVTRGSMAAQIQAQALSGLVAGLVDERRTARILAAAKPIERTFRGVERDRGAAALEGDSRLDEILVLGRESEVGGRGLPAPARNADT